ncbi:MAG: PEP-CTERM sorting domain-containing protein [Rubrivivax sp.]|nr:PEP-CTERM sorting domain-containing protein [Rubrivivax sp.]
MKLSSPRLLAAVAVACAGAFGGPAAFAQGKFNAAAAGDECNPGSGAHASVTCASLGSVGVTLQAWGFSGTAAAPKTLGTGLQTGFVRGNLGDFNSSGFGVYSGNMETGTNGQHAFDNVTSGCGTTSTPAGGVTTSGANSGCGGNIEALFLNFGSSKVNLTNVGIGWNGGDADLSVWAWTGAGNADVAATTAKGSTTTTGTTAAALTGWTLVSNHDFGSGIGSQNTGGTLYSSYFLVTTYFGAAGGGLTAGNDRFKLDSFTVGLCVGTLTGGSSGTGTGGGNGATCTPPGGTGGTVAEPGSLALAGMALLGVAGTRRRKWFAGRKAA